MFRTLTLLAPLAVVACTAATTTTVTTDAQAALTDGQALLTALEASGTLSTAAAGDADEIINGLQAMLTAFGAVPADATVEGKALSVSQTALQQVLADCSDAKVQTAGQLALAAVEAAAANESAGTVAQAETTLGVVLLDYLASVAPAAKLARA